MEISDGDLKGVQLGSNRLVGIAFSARLRRAPSSPPSTLQLTFSPRGDHSLHSHFPKYDSNS